MEGDKFYRGVFWVIDGALLAYPFIEGVYQDAGENNDYSEKNYRWTQPS